MPSTIQHVHSTPVQICSTILQRLVNDLISGLIHSNDSITLALRVCQVIFGVRSALDFDQLGTIYSDLGAIERHGLLKRKRCE